MQRNAEFAAIAADDGDLAAAAGIGPEVTRPTRRIVDLPPGAIAAIVNLPEVVYPPIAESK
ncbi:MAG TPA: hypothetical protein VMR45_04225 [Patescibacteria group bacterium]|nr:hypothetical protein [Patescibacteria group bacterium]